MRSRPSRGTRVSTAATSSVFSESPAARPFTGRSRPRTVATSAGYLDNEIVCAISEARGVSPTVGLSFVNFTTSEAVLCQLSDTQTFARTCHKIKVFGPSEIVFATTARDSKLLSIVIENLEVEKHGIRMTGIDRRYWAESAGHEYLERLAFPDDLESLKLSVAGNFYATCCFAAALHYLDLELGITFAAQALRIKFEPSEGCMMINLSTIASLELVQNACNAKSKDCLYGLLNETSTRMGARILKSNILQPSTDVEKISKRYCAVAELVVKEAMFLAVRDALKSYVDTDKVLGALVVTKKSLDLDFMEYSVNQTLLLKTFVDTIAPIWQALANATSEELVKIRELCNAVNYARVFELLQYALNEHAHYSTKPSELRNQRVWALKAGYNGYLDVARAAYTEVGDDIEQLIDNLKEETGINLELKYDPARQFFIRIKSSEMVGTPMPDTFINLHRNKNMIECQTMALIKLNQRIKDAHNEVVIISDRSIQELIDSIRANIHPLFKISEGIALLDMLTAFSHLAMTQNYVQPELLSTLAVKAGRHPILEKIHRERFVPNDVYATQQNRFQIITGCNMSGKSIYIRSIALMAIMAQIGCFIPADYASFPIVHQLFARLSTDDNLEANISTFASEMREMAFILHNIEPRSLVIIDELGRGTSTTDGLAIAIALSEALIESKALVWFVTHFRDLPRILAERPGVVNLHLAVDIDADFSRMKMTYHISDGCEEQKFYGLALARLASLPEDIIESATRISIQLHERNEARKQSGRALAIAKKRKLVLKLKEQLAQSCESDRDPEYKLQWLARLQEEFAVRMDAIEAEVLLASAHFDKLVPDRVDGETEASSDPTISVRQASRDYSSHRSPSEEDIAEPSCHRPSATNDPHRSRFFENEQLGSQDSNNEDLTGDDLESRSGGQQHDPIEVPSDPSSVSLISHRRGSLSDTSPMKTLGNIVTDLDNPVRLQIAKHRRVPFLAVAESSDRNSLSVVGRSDGNRRKASGAYWTTSNSELIGDAIEDSESDLDACVNDEIQDIR